MSLFKSFFVEIRKHKKTWFVMVAVLLFQLTYLYWQQDRDSHRAMGWLDILYSLPLLNAMILPITTSVLASLVVDAEHKGNTWKLLRTIQSGKSLLTGKIWYGILLIVVYFLIQTPMALVIGWSCGFEGAPDPLYYLLYFRNAVTVTLALYLLQSILSFVFVNQAVALSVGICGSMAGLFILFLPKSILYAVIPWGLYGATSLVQMDYNEIEKQLIFYYAPTIDHAFLWALLWVAVLLFVGYRLFDKLGTEGLITISKKSHASHIPHRRYATRIPAEWIKLRRTPIWLAFLTLPVLSAVIGTANYQINIEILQDGWNSLWSQHTLFFCLLFFPALIGVYCSYLWRLEHTGTNWNQIRVIASPWKIVRDKLFTAVLIAALTQLWTLVLFLISGTISNLSAPPFFKLLEWELCGFAGCVMICALQLFLSLVIRSFAVPIGVSILGSLIGFALSSKGCWYLAPHCLTGLGLRANNPYYQLNIPLYLAVCALYFALFFLLSVRYVRRHDVVTTSQSV
ncbi:MAG: ABC transporter permease [Candidatus Gastranaerophilales bacterium]|nr:ABC transporter permease [Candidatus Gastranaerophilales bacterium]